MVLLITRVARAIRNRMSLKVRALLVVVIGVVLGLSLSLGGGLIDRGQAPDDKALAWEQARLFAEVLERVKRRDSVGGRLAPWPQWRNNGRSRAATGASRRPCCRLLRDWSPFVAK